MDEADLTFTTKHLSETASLLLQVLNAGYRKGGCVYRINIKKKEKDQLEEFEVFGPKMFAGIGSLPDTLASRSVEILLQRARADEQVAKLRQREANLEAEPIRTALAEWADEVELPLEPRRMPEGLSDREEDYWEPLLVIAEEAGGGWPRLAREAAVALAKAKGSTDEGSLSMLLIEDLYRVWGVEEENLTTRTILSRLNALEEAPWSNLYGRELNAHDLARYARRYGIASRDVRQGTLPVGKGYRRPDWHEHAWSRFLPQSVLVGTEDEGRAQDAADIALWPEQLEGLA